MFPLSVSPMIVLHRIDPDRRAYRLYSVNVQPTLIDPWAVVCTWGSLECQYRRQRAIPCESQDAADRLVAQIVKRKLKRGYELDYSNGAGQGTGFQR